MDPIHGSLIVLRPAKPDDRQEIFNWLTMSDITSKMIGPPLFADNPIPSWEEFLQDYHYGFFSDDIPENGRSFIIELDNRGIGHINYNNIGKNNIPTELDLWMSSQAYCNKGYGTDAITTLCNYLASSFHCKRFLLAPSERNIAAVKAYQKCGFNTSNEMIRNFTPDYYDSLTMIKEFVS